MAITRIGQAQLLTKREQAIAKTRERTVPSFMNIFIYLSSLINPWLHYINIASEYFDYFDDKTIPTEFNTVKNRNILFTVKNNLDNPFLTIPNLLSLQRFMLVYIAFMSQAYGNGAYIGLGCFACLLAGISDYTDGAIARSFNQVSRVGKELDHWGDKSMLLLPSFFDPLAGLRILISEGIGKFFSVKARKRAKEHIFAPGSKLVTAIQMPAIALLYISNGGLQIALLLLLMLLSDYRAIIYFLVYNNSVPKLRKFIPDSGFLPTLARLEYKKRRKGSLELSSSSPTMS